MSKSTTYVITRAGQYEGTMAACRIPVRTTRYESVEAAMRDLAMVREGDTATLLAAQVSVRGDDGWYVYASQDDADSDDDGSCAIAVIERAPVDRTYEIFDGARWEPLDGTLDRDAADVVRSKGVASVSRSGDVWYLDQESESALQVRPA